MSVLSRILKENPNHWPAGTPGGKGGQFMPGKGGTAVASLHEPPARVYGNSETALAGTNFDDAQKAAVIEWVNGRKDAQRIWDNLSRHHDTPWHKQAVEGILVRKALEEYLAGRTPGFHSHLDSDSTKGLRAIIAEKGAEGAWEYLDRTGLIGEPSKPINGVNSSFHSCNPTEGCAKYCYATEGNYQRTGPFVKAELVSWAVETDPLRAAQMIGDEYTLLPEYRAGKLLRLFDKGDIDEEWLPMIEALNNRVGRDGNPQPVQMHIFSKRPDLLRRVNSMNLRLLSVDAESMGAARANPDLKVAYVYKGGSDDKDLIELGESRVGVILPVREFSKQELSGLPVWAKRQLCPLLRGTVSIGPNLYVDPATGATTARGQKGQPGKRLSSATTSKTRRAKLVLDTPPVERGTWNCARCDGGEGSGCGCYHNWAVTKEVAKAIAEPVTSSEAVARANKLLKDIGISIIKGESDGVSRRLSQGERDLIRATVDSLLLAVQRGIDIEATGRRKG